MYLLKPQLYSAFTKNAEGDARALMYIAILPTCKIHRIKSKYRINYNYTLTICWLFWSIGFTLMCKQKLKEEHLGRKILNETPQEVRDKVINDHRMYSREEVEYLLSTLYDDTDNTHFHKSNTIEEWIKENLK